MDSRSWIVASLFIVLGATTCGDDGDGDTSAGEEAGSGTSQGDASTTVGTTATEGSGSAEGSSSTQGSTTMTSAGDTGPTQCMCGGPDAPTACPDELGGCGDVGDGAECCDGQGLLWECIENDIGVVWQRAKC